MGFGVWSLGFRVSGLGLLVSTWRAEQVRPQDAERAQAPVLTVGFRGVPPPFITTWIIVIYITDYIELFLIWPHYRQFTGGGGT